MDDKAHFEAKQYWDRLSVDDRVKILKDYNFWSGFSTYLYEYIPEDLRTLIVLKTDIKDHFDGNTTMIF